jgi:hypothetical protein
MSCGSLVEMAVYNCLFASSFSFSAAFIAFNLVDILLVKGSLILLKALRISIWVFLLEMLRNQPQIHTIALLEILPSH